jgi:hypothetical protein
MARPDLGRQAKEIGDEEGPLERLDWLATERTREVCDSVLAARELIVMR